MMNKELEESFISLVRLGIGTSEVIPTIDSVEWQAMDDLANEQGLLGVILDGVEKLPRELRPERKAILQRIGQVLQVEQQHAVQEHAAAEITLR